VAGELGVSEVTVWYLQATATEELIAAADPDIATVVEARVKQAPFNRFLYELVGGRWQWVDRQVWTDEQWRDYAEADDLRTWVAWVEGSPAGYFELQTDAAGEVEICYFGLAEKFIGRGLGGYLLSEAIRQAWAWQASRVVVDTCSLDHPSALANYQARGMRIYKTDTRPG
jgi:GNAT superfamily N-acetyltransferase